jgi:hypothetical protein
MRTTRYPKKQAVWLTLPMPLSARFANGIIVQPISAQQAEIGWFFI